MILSNPVEPQSPQFRVLSEPQCEQLYQAALECLQRVGIQIPNRLPVIYLQSAAQAWQTISFAFLQNWFRRPLHRLRTNSRFGVGMNDM